MNIEQLYRDYGIQHATSGHKHCREGWVQTECPFCTGNTGLHLGYDTLLGRFVCWRCGGHGTIKVLSTLLRKNSSEIKDILIKYGDTFVKAKESKRKIRNLAFKLPDNTEEIKNSHRKYLIERDFNPDKIIEQWGILGTGASALLTTNGKALNYKHRIIIPYFWKGEMVTFDARDISKKAQNKYQACPLERELIPHKDILYGDLESKELKSKEFCIVVEGPTDVWRLGKYAAATSGIKYTPKQVREIAQFKRICVLFDDDPQAIVQSDKLVAELKFRGVECFSYAIKNDPGSMSQKEADVLVNKLINF